MFGSSSSAFFNTWRHRGYPSKPYWGLSKHAAICPPNFFCCNMGYRMNRGKNLTSIFMQVPSKNGYFPTLTLKYKKFKLEKNNWLWPENQTWGFMTSSPASIHSNRFYCLFYYFLLYSLQTHRTKSCYPF